MEDSHGPAALSPLTGSTVLSTCHLQKRLTRMRTTTWVTLLASCRQRTRENCIRYLVRLAEAAQAGRRQQQAGPSSSRLRGRQGAR